MEVISLPNKIELKPGSHKNEGVLTVEPLHRGYGVTLGNAIRRMLLSSLPGAAVTAVKIKGVTHEFSTVPHVKEDVLEIVLNLKMLRLKLWSDEPVKLFLRAKGEGEVTAADIGKDANVEIANPDLLIATLTDKGAVLEMEITVEKGLGYVPTEEQKKAGLEVGAIAVDAVFGPVKNVALRVEDARVGQSINFDKLTLAVETDGTISPAKAISEATKILMDHFGLFLSLPGTEETETKAEKKEKAVKKKAEKGESSVAKAMEDKERGKEEEAPKKKRGRAKKA